MRSLRIDKGVACAQNFEQDVDHQMSAVGGGAAAAAVAEHVAPDVAAARLAAAAFAHIRTAAAARL